MKTNTVTGFLKLRVVGLALLAFWLAVPAGAQAAIIEVGPHVTPSNLVPITQVVYEDTSTAPATTITQNASVPANENNGMGLGVRYRRSTPFNVVSIQVNIAPSGPSDLVDLIYNNIVTDVRLVGYGDPQYGGNGIGVLKPDGTQVTLGAPPTTAVARQAFRVALRDASENSDINNYVYVDGTNTSPPPGTADYYILYEYSLTAADYLFVMERHGNTYFELVPLGVDAQPITGANTLRFGYPTAPSNQPYTRYNWNSGLANSVYQSGQAQAFTVTTVSKFFEGTAVPARQQLVYGFRIDNDGNADVKFFSLSDDPFENNPGWPGTIGNRVWLDEDSNGYQDAGEPGIPNVEVSLYESGGLLFATTRTDVNGYYAFKSLPPGTYYVDVSDGTGGTALTLPFAGMTQTATSLPGSDFGNQDHSTTPIPIVPTPNRTGYEVEITVGNPVNLTADFGYNHAPGAIGDRVWADANGNGIQDPGEPGLSGVTVGLFYDDSGDGVYDTPYTVGDYNPVRVTDATGSYIFDNLPSGAYVVVVHADNFAAAGPLEGYTQTGDPEFFGTTGSPQDNKTTRPVLLNTGGVFINADFGYQPPADQNNSVGDRVWFDADADGVLDAGETGIAGVTVALIKDTNGDGLWDPDADPIIASTITDGDGEYLFTGVPDGNYLVWVNDAHARVGIVQTYDSDGVPTPVISAVALDPTGAVSTPVVDLDQDFGFSVPFQTDSTGLIGDRVWLDINGDGVQDPGEPGIQGVTVEIYEGANLLDSTVTDANGNYAFGGLAAGTYTINIPTPPPGMTQTFDADGLGLGSAHRSIVTIGGTEEIINLDQDFGYRGTGSIGNLVWEDIDGDGVRDPGEPGIGGVTLALYQDLGGTGSVSPGDPLIGTAVTDAGGAYSFDALATDDGGGDASYVVVVTDADDVLYGYLHTLGTADTNDHSQTDPYSVTLDPDSSPNNETADFGYQLVPTAVTMGDVDLITTGAPDFLRDIGAYRLDAEALSALLRAWDPAAAERLAGADRARLIQALLDYLDPDGDGRVVVFRWETLEERGTIGFYAERRHGGAWYRINAEMLPGLIASPMGAQYRLADPGARPGDGYQYRLIEIEARGTTREYGPFDLQVRD